MTLFPLPTSAYWTLEEESCWGAGLTESCCSPPSHLTNQSTHRGALRCRSNTLLTFILVPSSPWTSLPLTAVHGSHSQVTQCTSSRGSQERGHLPHFQLVPTVFKLSKLNQSSLPPAAHLIHCGTASCSTDPSVSTRSYFSCSTDPLWEPYEEGEVDMEKTWGLLL